MALNIKGAMLVCMACISGGVWLVDRVQIRDLPIPAPGVAAASAFETARVPHLPPLEGPVAAGRDQWVRQFRSPNAMDRQSKLNHDSGPAFASSATPPSAAVELPPLVLPTPAYVQAAQYASTADPGPAMDVRTDAAGPAAPTIGESNRADVALRDVTPVETEVPTLPSPETAIGPTEEHRVAKGERLVQIAERYYGSRDPKYVQVILDANPRVKSRNGRLLAGETLRMPLLDRETRTPQVALAADLSGAGAIKGRDATGTATASPQWYTIQAKDSLSSIAERYLSDKNRWPEIVKLNKKLDPNKIVPGMRIKLPSISVASR